MSFVALVGSPNSGKTTLFNWLTGRNQKVVNYPGSTVDVSIGEISTSIYESHLKKANSGVHIVDTPGTYSLFPKSPDEEVTLSCLFDENYAIEKVIVVIDATQIGRQLHILRQLQESNFSVVLALTMHDLYAKEKIKVDTQKLAQLIGVPVYPIDGVLGGGVRELAENILNTSSSRGNEICKKRPEVWSIDKSRAAFKEGLSIANQVMQKNLSALEKSKNLDDWFLHPVFGLISFIVIMTALFGSIYWLAAPVMDQVDGVFGDLIDLSKNFLGEGLISDLVSDGIISGLGAVFVFVPQIFILFFGISVLEDTGYLSRAATIIDKPLSKIGLNGKAFVPLLSGFACAVPAMMAARSINSAKERFIAMFIIPFMTCSARLPVYALLVGFLFADSPLKAGLMMAGLYLGAIFVGGVAAGLLNLMIAQTKPSFFLLELPLYRRPKLQSVLRNSFKRTQSYVLKTGPIILILSILIWVLTTFPNYKEADESLRLTSSYAAKLGEVTEPIFEPMGVDWRVGIGLISAFAAREVFVSSLAVVFNVTDREDEDHLREGLILQMREAKKADGRPVFTLASVCALLVFFMMALQCISTSAVAKAEMGSSSFAIVQMVSMNMLAYLAAVIAYSVIS